MALVLHSNTAADGNGTAQRTVGRNVYSFSSVVCWGNFGGGTLTLQLSPDGGTTWVGFAPAVAITVASAVSVNIPQAVQIRGVLTGSTAPALNCSVYGSD